ncbi:MAG: ParB/RepB/Spo0J family partition protein [Faecalibacterium sp.]|nr:ParB/RepB/Spo0J family partition protein [Ruminococcus sp.]MCM1391520.1 ParB/RepB/Spo0J family partition protein [Ruminococcus sp.]MCM1485508.1 ParB/RepB/Spo0J family partition protein [Faecalibacterium sp.]
MSEIKEIKISDLYPFAENPFKSCNKTEQEELTESVREFGIITPLIVRKIENGYEIISGHRRYEAAKMIGIETIPAYVKELSKDEATITFVDCNLSREKILPSEKAYGYKMKYDAMKRQGFRSDLTSSQVVTKSRSDEILAENSPDTRMQIQRFIRLTKLNKPLIDLVDEGRIALTPAYHLSFFERRGTAMFD